MDSKKRSPAFQFYPQDFLVGTADMSAEEIGGYIRLLCYQWAKGELIDDNRKLMQMSGIFDLNTLKIIKMKFIRQENGTIVNLKLKSVAEEQDKYRENQRKKASKRWESKNDAVALPKDIPEECPSPSSSPSSLSSSSPSSSNLVIGEKSKRFVPPTIKMVQEYCLERKNKVDPERFMDHYTSNGWMVGKTKMKDWKATIRNWEKNNYSNNQQNGNTTQQPKRTLEEQANDIADSIFGKYSNENATGSNDSTTEDSYFTIVE